VTIGHPRPGAEEPLSSRFTRMRLPLDELVRFDQDRSSGA
jgi:hypothetical protein